MKLYNLRSVIYCTCVLVFVLQACASTAENTTNANTHSSPKVSDLASVEITRTDSYPENVNIYNQHGEILWSLQPGESETNWFTPGDYRLTIAKSLDDQQLHDTIKLHVDTTRHYAIKIHIGQKSSNRFLLHPTKILEVVAHAGSALALVTFSVAIGSPGSVTLAPPVAIFGNESDELHANVEIKQKNIETTQ